MCISYRKYPLVIGNICDTQLHCRVQLWNDFAVQFALSFNLGVLGCVVDIIKSQVVFDIIIAIESIVILPYSILHKLRRVPLNIVIINSDTTPSHLFHLHKRVACWTLLIGGIRIIAAGIRPIVTYQFLTLFQLAVVL